MEKTSIYPVAVRTLCVSICLFLAVTLIGCGAGGLAGYQNTWLHPQEISTVYVEMFDSEGFRRGYEVKLTEAICKQIEAQTPYKIVTDRTLADSVMSGTVDPGLGVVAGDRFTGRPLEREASVRVAVTWKNLNTGRLMLENEVVYASVSFSDLLGQSFEYAADASLNKAARQVVERMERPWQ